MLGKISSIESDYFLAGLPEPELLEVAPLLSAAVSSPKKSGGQQQQQQSSANSRQAGGAANASAAPGRSAAAPAVGETGWKEVVRKSKKVSVPAHAISRVIGRGGCNINAIRELLKRHLSIDLLSADQLYDLFK